MTAQTATLAHAQSTPPWPTTPPAQICGNSSILDAGPTVPPEGAVIVPAGDNIDMFYDFRVPNTTFWFEPGEHTLGTDPFGQINPGDNTTFIGAPGAVIDGKGINKYAFTGEAQGVTIRYLTIRNFNAPMNEGVVNHNDGRGWTIEYSTIADNKGAGLMVGESNNTYRYNCIKDNGQYGINACCGTKENEVRNLILDHNEITGNNTDDWETLIPGCGCTGGVKFWINDGAVVTNNWIHDNHGPGLWLDNNNRNFLIANNYISDNEAEAIFIEAGYDTRIRNNNIVRNNIKAGRTRALAGDPFPVGAIYVSENGSPTGYGLNYVPTDISHNRFENNWGGVILWENPDRYSGSTAHTHVSGTIKIGDLYDDTACDGVDDTIPDTIADKYACRWSTENIVVEHNDFIIDKTAIGEGCDGARYCGINALFSVYGTYPEFGEYDIPTRVTFEQNNLFRNNNYIGDWHFAGFLPTRMDGSRVSWDDWTAPAPQPPYDFDHSSQPLTFGQDQGSTYTNDNPTLPPGPDPEPPPTAPNSLDADTATIEDSVGHWGAWYSSAISRSDDTAHGGAHSLRIDVTDPYGWGVVTGNWPGFATTHGTQRIGFWGKLGAGAHLQPKLTVRWYDASHAVLKTDTTTLPTLTNDWQHISAIVDAPAGTHAVWVSITGNGSAGDYLYLDDIVVGEVLNTLDTDTAGGENSAGQWQTWYSASISAASGMAYLGNGSLLIDITDPYGWGITLANWPGFAVTPGDKRVSYWARLGTGAVSGITLRVKWLDSSQQILQTDLLPVSGLTTTWQQAVSTVTAPEGTVSVFLDLYSGSGSAGDQVYVDHIVVTDVAH